MWWKQVKWRDSQQPVSGRQPGVSRSIGRFLLDCTLKILDTFLNRRRYEAMQVEASLQIILIRERIDLPFPCLHSGEPCLLRAADQHMNLAGNCLGYISLDRQDVAQVALVRLCP